MRYRDPALLDEVFVNAEHGSEYGSDVERFLALVPQAGRQDSVVLDRLDTAVRLEDINLRGFGFHGLSGKLKGAFAVSVSGNWRITFRFADADAIEVNLEDYH